MVLKGENDRLNQLQSPDERDIDQLDGCIYDCPIFPGVWSDWCELCCDKFVSKTDTKIACKL